jgi:hypothetical protein
MDIKSIKEFKKSLLNGYLPRGLDVFRAYTFMCHKGKLKTARWIFKHCEIPNIYAFSIAIASGQIKLAKWFHNRTSLCFSNERHYFTQYLVPQSCSGWVWRNFHSLCKNHLFYKVSDDWARRRELQLVSFFFNK